MVAWQIGLLLPLLLLGACSSNGTTPIDSGPLDQVSIADRTAAADHRLLAPDRTDATQVVQPVQFPRDEAPHSDPIEWWYYTGKLAADSGETYGFELVTFQSVVSGFPVYMGHYAMTDLKKGAFSIATRTSLTDQRGATSGFDLTVDGWKMSGHAGQDKLSAAMTGYALDLALSAKQPVVLHYGTGWMTVGSTKPLYYYSYTRMGATGTLTVDGVKKPVTGEAWMDHQWGTMGSDFIGWDWFSLRLDDATDVMLFLVRRAGKDGFSGGTVVDAKGAAAVLKSDEFSVSSTAQWKSPHSGATYPQGWTIKIPSAGIDVSVKPLMADQEFYETLLGMTPVYWEGLCSVDGLRNGKPIKGHAYVELTGYEPSK